MSFNARAGGCAAFLLATTALSSHAMADELANDGAVDEKRLPAYLESSSPTNLPLYRRHGFEVMEVLKPQPDAPQMWAMWREAR